MKIISVVGARPNFMKIAPFIKVINSHNLTRKMTNDPIEHILVHTGQHYDERMSDSFFNELDIPVADINLGIGSGSHAEQVGNTMIAFEKVLKHEKPDWIVVVGDVNATLACSVTAKKENVKCCHIEAGLRSGDLSMPEEINRLITDRISDLLLVPDRLSIANLKAEGVADSRIRFVGNIMIDTLDTYFNQASLLSIKEIIARNLTNDHGDDKLLPQNDEFAFAIVTIHRPSNVDNHGILKSLVDFLTHEATNYLSILWPLHPRTRKQLIKYDLYDDLIKHPRIIFLEPIGYLDMLRLNMNAIMVMTDSGGLQEECTVLGTPCITLRWNTERPVTLEINGGVNILTGNDIQMLNEEFFKAVKKERKPVRPELWDGKTAQRCLDAILNFKSD